MSKEKISIPEIIDLMVKDKNITKKTADEFIRMLISTIEDALLSGDSVKVKGLGTFKPQWNEARRSVDVNTGNEIIIPGFYRVVFAPENDLKDLINEPFAHLETILLADEEPNVKEKQTNSSENEERAAVKSDVNLSFLTTQAAEIKEILSDINALSGKKDTQEPKEIDKEDTELSAINSEVIADNEDVYEEEDDWNVEEENEDNLTVEDDEDEPKTPVSQQEDESDEPEEDEFIENDDFDIVRDVFVLYHSENAETEEKTVGEGIVQIQEEDNQILIPQKEEEILLAETMPEATDESLHEVVEEIISDSEEVPVYTDAEDEDVQLSSVTEEISSEETPAPDNIEEDSDENIEEKIEPISVNNDVVSDDYLDEDKKTETETASSLSQESHLEEDSKKKNILAVSLIIGSLLILGLGAFFLSPYITRSMKEKKNQERLEYIADSLENIKRVQFIRDSVIPNLRSDSLGSTKISEKPADSIKRERKIETDIPSTSAPAPVNNRNIYSTPRTYKEVLATEKMVVGSQLTKFARQYYGHPNFWVYIYEANKDKISDPNNVPAGIDVKIPKMDSRLVDPQNKESMNYALTLQSQYLK